MAIITIAELKALFTNKKVPTESSYEDLIDTLAAEGGSGDMEKSVYDTNDDGVVNSADNADTLDGEHADAFADAIHTHPGSDITSQVGDADTLDGEHASAFADASHTHPGSDITSQVGDADTLDGEHASAFANASHTHSGSDITSQVGDADTLDGEHADAFADASHTHPGSDITSQVGDADTVDGKHSSAFTPSGYGIGSYAENVSGEHMDSVRNTGFYRGNNLTNSPFGTAWTYFIVSRHDSNYLLQEAWNYYTSGSLEKYARRKTGSSWESWQQIYPAQWADIEGKPSTYPPSTHNHDSSYWKKLEAILHTYDIRTSKGLTVGSITDYAGDGDIAYTDTLISRKNSISHIVYGCGWYTTHLTDSSWSNVSKGVVHMRFLELLLVGQRMLKLFVLDFWVQPHRLVQLYRLDQKVLQVIHYLFVVQHLPVFKKNKDGFLVMLTGI